MMRSMDASTQAWWDLTKDQRDKFCRCCEMHGLDPNDVTTVRWSRTRTEFDCIVRDDDGHAQLDPITSDTILTTTITFGA